MFRLFDGYHAPAPSTELQCVAPDDIELRKAANQLLSHAPLSIYINRKYATDPSLKRSLTKSLEDLDSDLSLVSSRWATPYCSSLARYIL